ATQDFGLARAAQAVFSSLLRIEPRNMVECQATDDCVRLGNLRLLNTCDQGMQRDASGKRRRHRRMGLCNGIDERQCAAQAGVEESTPQGAVATTDLHDMPVGTAREQWPEDFPVGGIKALHEWQLAPRLIETVRREGSVPPFRRSFHVASNECAQ